MQINVCHTEKEWAYISTKIGKQKLSEFFIWQVNSKIRSAVDAGDDKKIVKKFMISDKELQRDIKALATKLKIRPAKLLAGMVFAPVLYKE